MELDEWVKEHDPNCNCAMLVSDDPELCDCGQAERVKELQKLRAQVALLTEALDTKEAVSARRLADLMEAKEELAEAQRFIKYAADGEPSGIDYLKAYLADRPTPEQSIGGTCAPKDMSGTTIVLSEQVKPEWDAEEMLRRAG